MDWECCGPGGPFSLGLAAPRGLSLSCGFFPPRSLFSTSALPTFVPAPGGNRPRNFLLRRRGPAAPAWPPRKRIETPLGDPAASWESTTNRKRSHDSPAFAGDVKSPEPCLSPQARSPPFPISISRRVSLSRSKDLDPGRFAKPSAGMVLGRPIPIDQPSWATHVGLPTSLSGPSWGKWM